MPFMLSVDNKPIMLSVFMLSVVMLNVVAPLSGTMWFNANIIEQVSKKNTRSNKSSSALGP
jgi:hypothetical protein